MIPNLKIEMSSDLLTRLLILAKQQTGSFAPGCKFNVESTDLLLPLRPIAVGGDRRAERGLRPGRTREDRCDRMMDEQGAEVGCRASSIYIKNSEKEFSLLCLFLAPNNLCRGFPIHLERPLGSGAGNP